LIQNIEKGAIYMKVKALIAVSLALVTLLALAAPAFAATQKVDLVKYTEAEPNHAAKAGYATFTTNQGDRALVVSITVTNATASTKYQVHLITECQGDYILGYLTTNSKGKWGGQNEQYGFTKVLSAGNHTVSLVLKPMKADGTPDEFSKTWIWGPNPLGSNITIKITRN
jgi:opacity protein-like surface antigen